jgi:hypothetical protein
LAYGLLEYSIVDPLKRQFTVQPRRVDPGTTVAELRMVVEEDASDPGAKGRDRRRPPDRRRPEPGSAPARANRRNRSMAAIARPTGPARRSPRN